MLPFDVTFFEIKDKLIQYSSIVKRNGNYVNWCKTNCRNESQGLIELMIAFVQSFQIELVSFAMRGLRKIKLTSLNMSPWVVRRDSVESRKLQVEENTGADKKEKKIWLGLVFCVNCEKTLRKLL